MQQFSQNICAIHQESVVQEDCKDQCLACLKIQYQNEIIKIEESIKEYQKILDNKQSEDKENILQNIETTKQQKIKLNNNFNERSTQHCKQKFRLLKQYPNNYYRSFSFNSDSTLLFAGGFRCIKVFKFKNGKKLLQKLTTRTGSINSLLFMNESKLLVFGNFDNFIDFWKQNQNSSWQPNQTLEKHQDTINIIIHNEDEDLLISGSKDQTIKFWRKNNINFNCQQTIETKCEVLGLSLNKSSRQLISCGLDLTDVLVTEWDPDMQLWNIVQTIQGNYTGSQLCFINDQIFVFQGEQEFLEIYEYQRDERQFIKQQQIEVQITEWKYCISYPCRYLQSKKILIIKNGRYLNYFGIKDNQTYVLQQQIEFYNDWFFGNISNDGQFLVTTDYNNAIQVRKMNQQEQI